MMPKLVVALLCVCSSTTVALRLEPVGPLCSVLNDMVADGCSLKAGVLPCCINHCAVHQDKGQCFCTALNCKVGEFDLATKQLEGCCEVIHNSDGNQGDNPNSCNLYRLSDDTTCSQSAGGEGGAAAASSAAGGGAGEVKPGPATAGQLAGGEAGGAGAVSKPPLPKSSCPAFATHCTRCGSVEDPTTDTDSRLLAHTYTSSPGTCIAWCQQQEGATCCHQMTVRPDHAYESCNAAGDCWCGAYTGSHASTPVCGPVASQKYAIDCTTPGMSTGTCSKFGASSLRCGSATDPVFDTDSSLLLSTYALSSDACAAWCQRQAGATCCHYMTQRNDPLKSCRDDGTCWCGAYTGSPTATPGSGSVAQQKYAVACTLAK